MVICHFGPLTRSSRHQVNEALAACVKMEQLSRPSLPLRLSARVIIKSLFWAIAPLLLVVPSWAHAQDNYEIQVYGSELVPRGRTMVELHSNFTVSGTTIG